MNILPTVKGEEIKVIVGYEGRSSETRRSGGRSRSTRRGERLGWLGEGRRHERDRVYEGRRPETRRAKRRRRETDSERGKAMRQTKERGEKARRGEGLAIPLYETDR